MNSEIPRTGFHMKFRSHQKLSSLDISDNVKLTLTKANLGSLVQNMTNLKQLHLSWVEMFSTFLENFVNASSLTSHKLNSCGFYGEFPFGIFHLPNLEVLYVYKKFELTALGKQVSLIHCLRVGLALLCFEKKLLLLSCENKLIFAASRFQRFFTQNCENKLFLTPQYQTNTTSIGSLRSLTVFGIYYCNFDPHVPSSLRNLTQLFYLDISSFYDPLYWPGK
ncbi:hypothetical protein DVH24_002407 [Malus domestica]|uniref:Uncharacterized protein n=1 Tax=Malus domestica TaxID=3750 RepID=A0A498IKE6_MALDO|nr:hypothetical protein DVH24_002407 [Malus domestica]